MKNKIISKKQFLNLNKISAVKMKKDQILCKKALDVLIKADKYRWLHQTSWLGEPILNLPEDIFILQEIIWRTKPQYIIETGVAWGGSLLFNSLLLDYIGGKKDFDEYGEKLFQALVIGGVTLGAACASKQTKSTDVPIQEKEASESTPVQTEERVEPPPERLESRFSGTNAKGEQCEDVCYTQSSGEDICSEMCCWLMATL